jgi:nitrogen regulatory protein PII-like uncharacterized protein
MNKMQERWTTQIDEITTVFRKSFGTLTIEELNWRPNPNVWSIGQNLDHLIIINGTYFPVIDAVRAGNYKLPLIARSDLMVSFLGRTILKSVQPDRRRRMKTFSIWEPTKSDVGPDIWDGFEMQQENLKTLIRSSSDLLDNGVVISSPAKKNIVYKLETAFDIIVAHEWRHFEQSKEIDGIRKV